MSKHSSGWAVQAAIRTKTYQDRALERGDFKAALELGLVADEKDEATPRPTAVSCHDYTWKLTR
ncbi:MAG: hypothetical protein HY813_03365 [Candidatus Portnoybacteria bacterium]|nr:hypothetical protein [Candidatus Portnoybacteria bacterium]